MNQTDKKILNALQENFPFIERPYLEISKKIKVPEKAIIERAQKLLNEGVIRRFGILINHKTLHYFSTLLGVRISAKELPCLVEYVTKRPEVTHCYNREGEYNIWFTFLTPKRFVFEKFLKQLAKKFGKENILNLPTIKSFKLKTTFNV